MAFQCFAVCKVLPNYVLWVLSKWDKWGMRVCGLKLHRKVVKFVNQSWVFCTKTPGDIPLYKKVTFMCSLIFCSVLYKHYLWCSWQPLQGDTIFLSLRRHQRSKVATPNDGSRIWTQACQLREPASFYCTALCISSELDRRCHCMYVSCSSFFVYLPD